MDGYDVCKECAATVELDKKATHARWHQDLNAHIATTVKNALAEHDRKSQQKLRARGIGGH